MSSIWLLCWLNYDHHYSNLKGSQDSVLIKSSRVNNKGIDMVLDIYLNLRSRINSYTRNQDTTTTLRIFFSNSQGRKSRWLRANYCYLSSFPMWKFPFSPSHWCLTSILHSQIDFNYFLSFLAEICNADDLSSNNNCLCTQMILNS